MTDDRREDVVKLEDAIRRRLLSTCDQQFRLLSRTIPSDTPRRLEKLWETLILEGPGVELIRVIVEAYEQATRDGVRREDLWRRLSPVIDGADETRLTSLEQLVTMFEAVPVKPVQEDDVVDAEIVEVCVFCDKEIRFEGDKINTDEPERGRGWFHVETDEVPCDLDPGPPGFGVTTHVATPIRENLDESSGEPIVNDPETCTPTLWTERTGIRLSDPRGWSHGVPVSNFGTFEPRSVLDPITRDEFIARAQWSSVTYWPRPLLDDDGGPT